MVWECPKCKKRMHSSWDSRDKKNVICIHCGYEFENKYYNDENDNIKSK